MAGGLALTEMGETCKGQGLLPIETLDECKASKQFIRKYYPTYSDFVKPETRPGYPTGCYVWIDEVTETYKGYFNDHSSGAGNAATRALCKGAKGRNTSYKLRNIVG